MRDYLHSDYDCKCTRYMRNTENNYRDFIVAWDIFGITWFAALILSLASHGDGNCSCGSRLDDLEKLAKLYKSKVISKTEYDKMKAKLLNNK